MAHVTPSPDARRTTDPKVDALTAELNADDLAAVRKEARAQVAEEKRKEAMKAAMDLALREERVAAGLEKADPLWEMVKFRPDLPDNITPNACLIIDGRSYWHGMEYVISLDKARTLLDMQARAWENEARIEGKWFDPRKPRNTPLSPRGAMNAPMPVGRA